MPPSLKTSSTFRIVGLLVVLVVVVTMVPMASYLSVVFGWTNPSQTPPGGSGILTALNGNLGINAPTPSSSLTVGGTISALTLTDLIAPIADSDAANKAYVDANGGGGGGAMVLYGVGLNLNQAGRFMRAAGAIGNGCRGVYGGVFTPGCAAAVNVPAGNGTMACPVGWTEAYAGYGPMNTFFSWYGATTWSQDPTGGGGSSGSQNESDVPNVAVIGTDSICSSAAYAFMYDVTYAQVGGPGAVAGSNSVLTACNDVGCNTCRVCYK